MVAVIILTAAVIIVPFTQTNSIVVAAQTGTGGGGAPDLHLLESITFEGEIRSAVRADFNGDGTADILLATVLEDDNDDEPNDTIYLVDGSNGEIAWTRHYEESSVKGIVEKDNGLNVILSYSNYLDTEFPGYAFPIPMIAALDGTTGETLWSINTLCLGATIFDMGNKDALLLAGNNYMGDSVRAIDVERGFVLWSLPGFSHFSLIQQASGEPCIITSCDRNITAHDPDDRSVLWSYDFFDNEVYHVESSQDSIVGGDGFIVHYASKSDCVRALIIIDTASGQENNVVNLSKLSVISPYLLDWGHLDGDQIPDFLVGGISNSSEFAVFAISGSDGSELWRTNLKIDLEDLENTFFLKSEIDGNDCWRVLTADRVLEISGEDGAELWSLEFPEKYDRLFPQENDDGEDLVILAATGSTLQVLSIGEEEGGKAHIWIVLLGIVIIGVVVVGMWKRGRGRLGKGDGE